MCCQQCHTFLRQPHILCASLLEVCAEYLVARVLETADAKKIVEWLELANTCKLD